MRRCCQGQGRNALDQIRWREGQLVYIDSALITGRFAVLVGPHLFGFKAFEQATTHKGAQEATEKDDLRFNHAKSH